MENITDAPILSPKGTFPAAVAKVIDEYKLVINRGSEDGIREGQRVLVYRVSDEDIKDPNTGESLGYLELVRGTGKVIWIQDKMSLIESDQYKTISRRIPRDRNQLEMAILGLFEEQKEKIPFDNPQLGDKVKPI